jgi:hypothetical protein
MEKFIVPAVLFMIAIACGVATVMLLKDNDVPNANTKALCDAVKLTGKKCAIWDGEQCRKGSLLDGGTCESDGSAVPLVLAVLTVVFLLTSIGSVIYEVRKK